MTSTRATKAAQAGVEKRLDELADGGGFEALARAQGIGRDRRDRRRRQSHRHDPASSSSASISISSCSPCRTRCSDQDALDEELPLCLARGVSVVIGAPFASGILASGRGRRPRPMPISPRPARWSTRRGSIAGVCERHRVPLGAAALQFPLAHPAVVSVIPGPSSADQVRANVKWIAQPIPGCVLGRAEREGTSAQGRARTTSRVTRQGHRNNMTTQRRKPC